MTGVLAVIVSGLLTWWFTTSFSPFQIHDAPNERSLHKHPTPRTGGLAILIGIAFGWVWLTFFHALPHAMSWILVATILVVGISAVDDIINVSPILRLATHLSAAGMLVLGGIGLFSGWSGAVITILGVVWMINLYNFMDGMDGFAGGMTVAGFVFLGITGWWDGAQLYAFYCWAVAASASGFLLFNFPPARIFMGDSGSATLGVLAAGFALWGIHMSLFPLWFPFLVFSPFIVDATITLIRRVFHHEKVWRAHRTHYYQRLVLIGWGHKRTVLAEYALMLGVGFSSLLLLHSRWWLAGLIIWCAIYILLAYMVNVYCVKQQIEE